MQLNISTIRYQRNGVCGTGFVHILFSSTEDGVTRDMVGFIVPREDADGNRLPPEHYGVICPAEPREMWRGDRFVDQLWAAASTALDDGSAHRWSS